MMTVWTAIGAGSVIVIQLFYVAYRFGQIDERVSNLKAGQNEIKNLLLRHVKL
jgi:hypothetical protein